MSSSSDQPGAAGAGAGARAEDRVRIEIADHVAIVTLARGDKHNALDLPMFDGIDAHAEDGWVGRRVRIGEAEVTFNGHVGRCLTTNRDPDSGAVTLPTLDVMRAYRGELDRTEPLPFGIYGEVVSPGTVRLGDAVVPVDG